MRLSKVIAGTGHRRGGVGERSRRSPASPATRARSCPGAALLRARRARRTTATTSPRRRRARGRGGGRRRARRSPARRRRCSSRRRRGARWPSPPRTSSAAPATRCALAGVTGTNGKTTVTYLVEACARAAGAPDRRARDRHHRFPGVRAARRATPRPSRPRSQALLAEMRDGRARGRRCWRSPRTRSRRSASPGIALRGRRRSRTSRATTSTTTATWSEYFAAKRRLFTEHLAPERRRGGERATTPTARASPTSSGPGARRVALRRARRGRAPRRRTSRSALDGIARDARRRPPGALERPLAARRRAQPREPALRGRAWRSAPASPRTRSHAASRASPRRARPARARSTGRGVAVFVDYAHTDDALARALEALRAAWARAGSSCVFGCGGDRDRGQAAADGRGGRPRARTSWSSRATTRAPRTRARSSPRSLPGLERAGAAPLAADEARARRARLPGGARPARGHRARRRGSRAPGDVVLIAGKGHEDYQIVGAEKRHFDDREEAAPGPRRSTMTGSPASPPTSSPRPTGGRWTGTAPPAEVARRLHRHPHRSPRAASSSRSRGERFDAHDFLAEAAAGGRRRGGGDGGLASPPSRRRRALRRCSRCRTRSRRSARSRASTAAASASRSSASPAPTARRRQRDGRRDPRHARPGAEDRGQPQQRGGRPAHAVRPRARAPSAPSSRWA